MSVHVQELREAQIVWVIVRDRNGFRKRRPAIILTPTSEISGAQPLVIMAVTTTYPDPAPPEHIEA